MSALSEQTLPLVLLFAGVGLALLIAAVVGKPVTIAGATIPAPTSGGGRTAAGVLGGVCLLVAGVIGGVIPWPPWPPPPPTPTPIPTASDGTPTPTATAVVTIGPTQTASTGCVLTISFPFASLHKSPDLQSTEISDVPRGQYQTSDTTVVEFAGQSQRWFQITASGKTGWLLYDTILVESKSAACP